MPDPDVPLYLPRPWLWLVRVLAMIAAVLLGALMVMTVTDIVARSLGLFSVYGIIELGRGTLLLIGCFGQAYVFAMRGHIVVDLISAAFPLAVSRVLDRVALVLAAVGLALLAWYMAQGGWDMHRSGERTETLLLSPLLTRLPAAAGLLVSAVTAVLLAVLDPPAMETVRDA